MRGVVHFDPARTVSSAGVGRVGDKPDGPRHRTCAVKRALWSGERLDPRQIISVQIERTLNRGDRQLVEIGADGRQ